MQANFNEQDFDVKVKYMLVDQFTRKVDILGCIENYNKKIQNNRLESVIYDIVKRKFVEMSEFIWFI